MKFGGNVNNLGMMRTLEERGIAGNADGSTNITQLLRPSSRREIAEETGGHFATSKNNMGRHHRALCEVRKAAGIHT